jgi:hypothetical protein
MQYHPDKNPNCEGLMKKLNIAKMTAWSQFTYRIWW